MGKIFVTSDLHFGHKRILDFDPLHRPYQTVEEMDEALIEIWNTYVSPEDTVFNLGDVIFYHNLEKVKSILGRLNGKHILIFGNHDQVIKRNLDTLLIEKKTDGHTYLYKVAPYFELEVDKQLCVMFHYPIAEWNKMHYGSIHLYGHLHSTIAEGEDTYRFCNVGFDIWGKPIELLPLLSSLNNSKIKPRKG